MPVLVVNAGGLRTTHSSSAYPSCLVMLLLGLPRKLPPPCCLRQAPAASILASAVKLSAASVGLQGALSHGVSSYCF